MQILGFSHLSGGLPPDKGRPLKGCKSRPLVNADALLLTNRGSEAFFRFQVSGLRIKGETAVYGVKNESFPQGWPITTEHVS
jgi:hypothetical protein